MLVYTVADSPVQSDSECLSVQARERLKQLEVINKFATALHEVESFHSLLQFFAEETQNVLAAAAVTLWFYDPAEKALRQIAASGSLHLASRLEPGQGMVGNVFLTGQPYASAELKRDPVAGPSAGADVPADWMGVAVPIRGVRTTIGVLLASVPAPHVFSPDQMRLLAIVADLVGTAIHQVQLYRQTDRRLKNVEALRVVDIAIGDHLDLPVTLHLLLDQIVAQMNVDAAAVYVLDSDETLVYRAGRGFRKADPERARLRWGKGVVGRAAAEGYFQICEATQDSSPALAAAEGFVTHSALPILSQGRVRGVLELYHRTRFTPTQEWLDWLDMFARQAALAIESAGFERDLERSKVEWMTAYDEIVQAWGHAVEMAMHEPACHSTIVADETTWLARELHVPENQIVHMRRGAILHDVGMLKVPESIRLKTSALTADERAMMQRHPVYACELLSSVAFLQPALQIPFCHHEKWDGTGYPNHFCGEEIPLAARIFAVVDVWDALRSERPYRPAWPEAAVLKRIHTLAGSHLDPNLVQVFLRHKTSSGE